MTDSPWSVPEGTFPAFDPRRRAHLGGKIKEIQEIGYTYAKKHVAEWKQKLKQEKDGRLRLFNSAFVESSGRRKGRSKFKKLYEDSNFVNCF